MRLRSSSLAGVLVATALTRPSRADDPEPYRLSMAMTGAIVDLRRMSSSPHAAAGALLGTEQRVHLGSRHGFVGAYTVGGGGFGPTVRIADVAYSYRLLGPRDLHGVTGAVYLDAGPALGFVQDAPPARDHTVLGARTSVAADAQLWNFVFGAIVAYRAGIPLSGAPDAWEGALSAGFRAGVVLDVD